MVANINLLPKREQGTNPSRILILIAVILFLGIGATMYVKMQHISTQTTDVSKQLAVAKVKVETQQKTAGTTTSSAADLEKEAKKLAGGQVKLLPVLTKMTSFLPERGLFQSFTYKEPNIISAEIRFDNDQDAAYYLSRLTKEPWIQEAKLVSVKAQDIPNQQITSNRYIAQYEVTIIQDKVKELDKEGSQ
ncbi:hypothetical protein [Ectobacillus polymachus]|uniref:hypothetical protein n=1 Tax=Ectobacillus polymachus TaxID=1508806 RepID=UPI003A8C0990